MRTQYERWIDPRTGELHESVEVLPGGEPKAPTLGRAYIAIAVLQGAYTVEEARALVYWTQYEKWVDVASGELQESVTVFIGDTPLPPTPGRAYIAIAVLQGIHTIEAARELVHWTQYERWIDPASGELQESATVFVGDAPLPPTLGRAYLLVSVIQGIHSLAAARRHAEASTARQVARVEVWDARRRYPLQIPGTSPAEFDLWPYVSTDEFQERLGEPTRLTLTLEVGCAPVVSDPVYLARRRILRVHYTDGSFEEFRITRFDRELSGDSAPTLDAESLWTVLDTRIARRVLEGSGFVDVSLVFLRRPAQQLLEEILADAPAPYIAGSAGEFAAREASIVSRGSTHLALLRQLCQDLGCEWEAVWDAEAGAYRINLVREVGGPGVRPIEQGSGTKGNRRTLRRSQDGTDLFTRVVPLAGPDDEITTIARATWPIEASTFSGGRTTLQLGGEPIWVDGMPFGLDEPGEFGAGDDWFPVVSTQVPGTVVVEGDARVLTSGTFRLASGADLVYLADPAAEVEAGVVERPVRRADIPPFANLLEEAGVSADLTQWAGGLPVGTAKVGNSTITPTTDPRYAQAGGMAALIEADAGEGIETIAVQIEPTSLAPYFSTASALRIASGGVRLEIIGADGKSYPLGDAATSSEDVLRALTIGGVQPPAGGTRIRITALKDGTVFALDSWTLAQSATAYSYAPEMGPQALWRAGARLLAAEGGLTPDSLDGAIFDVAHFDGENADEILCGSRVQVDDSGLDLETRVVGLIRGYKDQGAVAYQKTVELSRRRQDLIDYLSDDDVPDRRLAEGGTTRPAPAVAVQGVRVNAAGKVVVSAGGGDLVSRILVTAAVGGEPPVPLPTVHHGVIDGAAGTVATSVEAEPGDVVRVRARGESPDGVLGPVAEAEYQVPTDPEVPEYAECRARIVSAASDAEHYVVEVTAVPASAQVYLYSLQGATIVSGPGVGIPAPSGTQWKLKRPAPRSADGEAVWRTDPAGYVLDDDAVVIPAIGRDTVPLTLRVRQIAKTATTRTVRVSVGDPHYTESSDPVTISYVQQGAGGVSPASPQQIPVSAIRATPDATESQAGGYVDFIISRPAHGTGDGRVVFTAARPGRVQDTDPVDVPELPPGALPTPLPPTARVEIVDTVGTIGKAQVSGRDWQGGTTGLQYRYRVYPVTQTPPPDFGAWTNLASDGRSGLLDVPQHPRHTTRIDVQVRDSGQRESEIATATLDGAMPALGPGGRLVPTEAPEGSDTPLGLSLQQAASSSNNLLSAAAARPWVPNGTIGTIYRHDALTTPINDVGLSEGVMVGMRAFTSTSPSNGVNGRLQVGLRFLASDNSIIEDAWSPEAFNTNGTIEMGLEPVPIPATTRSIVPIARRVTSIAGNAPFLVERLTLTRGPLGSPYEEPAGRPGRDGIDVWDGALNPRVERSDGARLLAITSGMRIYEAANNSGFIPFDQAYQHSPAVIVLGPMGFAAGLGTTSSQFRREFAEQVTASGIGNVVMEMESMTGQASRSQNFPAAVLTAQGESRDLGGSGLSHKAGDGKYTGIYGVNISCTAENDGFSRITVRVVVAIETRRLPTDPIFLERFTNVHAVTAEAGNTSTVNAPGETIVATDTRLDVGDQVRLRLKSVEIDTRGAGGTYNIAITPQRVTYLSYTPSRVTQTPDGRKGLVIVFGAT